MTDLTRLIMLRHRAAGYEEKVKLLQISAFFNNEGNDGAGVTILPHIDPIKCPLSVVHTLLQDIDPDNMSLSMAQVQEQLPFSIAKYKANPSNFHAAAEFIMLTYMAEIHGIIPNDEYNGLQFIYEGIDTI